MVNINEYKGTKEPLVAPLANPTTITKNETRTSQRSSILKTSVLPLTNQSQSDVSLLWSIRDNFYLRLGTEANLNSQLSKANFNFQLRLSQRSGTAEKVRADSCWTTSVWVWFSWL